MENSKSKRHMLSYGSKHLRALELTKKHSLCELRNTNEDPLECVYFLQK